MSEALKDFNDVHTALIRSRGGVLNYISERQQAHHPTIAQGLRGAERDRDFLTFQEVWKAGVRKQITPLLQGSSGPVLGDTMVWGRLPGNVGYIEIGSMSEVSVPIRRRPTWPWRAPRWTALWPRCQTPVH